jgi:hypothetical protein
MKGADMPVFHLSGNSINEIISELRSAAIAPEKAKAVLYFAVEQYEPLRLARKITRFFPKGTPVVGCSAYRNIFARKYENDQRFYSSGVIVAVIEEDIAEKAAAVLFPSIRNAPNPEREVDYLSAEMGIDLRHADPEKYAGIMIGEGAEYGQNYLLDALGDRLVMPIVGGTASDEGSFSGSWISLGETVSSDAAALITLQMKRKFLASKTQSLAIDTSKGPWITGRDPCAPLRVKTLGGRPAAEVVAERLNVPMDRLQEEFKTRDLEVVFGFEAQGQIFAYCCYRIDSEGAVIMNDAPRADLPLYFLDWTDIAEDQRQAMQRAEKTLGGAPSFLLDFLCFNRYRVMNQSKKAEAYLSAYPKGCDTAGFVTFGEIYITHLNATSSFFAVK